MGMGKLTFVAWLYLASLGSIVAGAMGLYDYFDYSFNYQDGKMKIAKPVTPGLNLTQDNALTVANVSYETAAGEISVPNKHVFGKTVKRLLNGEKIPVRFSTKDPRRVYEEGEQPKLSLSWLVFGAILLGVAIYAHRLLRRESVAA